MSSSWLAIVSALAGGLISTVSTFLTNRSKQNAERLHRRDETKQQIYADLLRVCTDMMSLRVWPVNTADEPEAPQPLVDAARDLSGRIAFLSPAPVNTAVDDVLAALVDMADKTGSIRATSERGHQGRVDQRHADAHREAVEVLRSAVETFVDAARKDLGVPVR